MTNTRWTAATLALVGVILPAIDAAGQVAERTRHVVPVDVTASDLVNDTKLTRVLFEHTVDMEEAGSLQLRFGHVILPSGCFLRMTSLRDGATQHHTAATLRQWRNTSAWFNGHAVLVEFLADPGAAPGRVSIVSATYLGDSIGVESICGSTDDRALSFSDRDGRLMPVGCTAWIIDDVNHCFLTAGHCVDGGTAETMQFNVPLSDPDGNLNHPGPEDQYAVDPESMQDNYVTIGNDWAYFGCFPNTETGLTAFQAQGDFHVLDDAAPPVSGQTINITGYGSVGSGVDPQWYQVQKTHSGPYRVQDGTSIAYQTDTSGGNSGSAVLDESTGMAIGIHTNAGCNSGGGENWGCGIHVAGLQNALANPQGVCIPNVLAFAYPDGRPGSLLPGAAFDLIFTVEAANEEPLVGSIELVVTIDGETTSLPVTDLGEGLFQGTIPALACDQNVTFYLRAQGDGGGVAFDPSAAPSDQHGIAVGDLVESVLLDESLNSGIPSSWTTSGLWHGSDGHCGGTNTCSDSSMAYFGIESACSYDTGDDESGSMTLSGIPLDGGGSDLRLRYCSKLSCENHNDYDIARVLANGIEVDRMIASHEWETREIDLSGVNGSILVLRFEFDTVDDIDNDYTGWLIDDIQVIGLSVDCDPPPDCPGDVDGSGVVDVTDLLIVISSWGETDGAGDANGDGTVNATDILMVLDGWGPC
jgi:V8-like Glu-specific endopeptidase